MPRISLAVRNKTRTPTRGHRRRQRGQALIEMALVFPIFLVLVMGIIDFGWALRSYITLTNAAREGARLAVVGCTSLDQENDVKTRVEEYASTLKPTPSVTVTPTCTVDGPKAGAEVAVKADYDYGFITPLGAFITELSGPLHLSSTTRMRTE